MSAFDPKRTLLLCCEISLLALGGHSSFDLIRVLRPHGGPTDRLQPPAQNFINHRDLEGIVVNPVNSSAVAQAKPRRSRFDPFERRFFCPFLIFKNSVFLSVIVNEFKFVYLACFSVFHWRLFRLKLRRLVDLETSARHGSRKNGLSCGRTRCS